MLSLTHRDWKADDGVEQVEDARVVSVGIGGRVGGQPVEVGDFLEVGELGAGYILQKTLHSRSFIIFPRREATFFTDGGTGRTRARASCTVKHLWR